MFDLAAEMFAAALASVPRFYTWSCFPPALVERARHKFNEALRTSRIQDEARRALAMQPIELDDEAIEILEDDSLRSGGRAPRDPGGRAARAAITAHHVEERGYDEIASELRCSESVVRKRVSRGLAAMRAQLRDGEAYE